MKKMMVIQLNEPQLDCGSKFSFIDLYKYLLQKSDNNIISFTFCEDMCNDDD